MNRNSYNGELIETFRDGRKQMFSNYRNSLLARWFQRQPVTTSQTSCDQPTDVLVFATATSLTKTQNSRITNSVSTNCILW